MDGHGAVDVLSVFERRHLVVDSCHSEWDWVWLDPRYKSF